MNGNETAFNFNTVFDSVADQVTNAIGAVAPIALAVGGLVLAISLGWKLLKRFAGR